MSVKMKGMHLLGLLVVSTSLLSNLLLFLPSRYPTLYNNVDVNNYPPPPLRDDGKKRKEGIMLPDWRQAVDCSAYDNMCMTTQNLEDKYKQYPFPLSRHIKNLEEFDHEILSNVPDGWRDALMAPRQEKRVISYIYPAEAPTQDVAGCMKDATTVEWQLQIDNLLESGRIQRETVTNMVSFTISDYNYAFDMMHDVFEMNNNIVGFSGSFFMVALDDQTVELACTYGYPIVVWPNPNQSNNSDATSHLKQAVANTKLEVSLYLIKKGFDFFFWEMDVWFLKSPKELLAAYHKEEKHDLLASTHSKDPLDLNIGVFSVTASERTQEYFELCINMAKKDPKAHDQAIMGRLLMVAFMIAETGKESFQFTDTPLMTKAPVFGFYNAFEIATSEHPIVTKNTMAIHTLCGAPLRKPWGKKIMAKELGAWTGFSSNGVAGYYARSGEHRRYLWMDGHDSPSTYNLVQSFEWGLMVESFLVDNFASLKFTMAVLLALSRRTGRIFIMPKLLGGKSGMHYLWTVLDFEPVDEMNIDYRETNFPHNKKAWSSEEDPFPSFARTALAPLEDADMERTMYVQYVRRSDDDGITIAWKFDKNMTDEKALDSWWALHTAIPEVDSSELLLVNPHFISAPYVSRLLEKMSNQDYTPTVAEEEVFYVYQRLKWCKRGDPIVIHEKGVGQSSAELSCHGKGRH